jgi:hypothetical protein
VTTPVYCGTCRTTDRDDVFKIGDVYGCRRCGNRVPSAFTTEMLARAATEQRRR